MTLPERTLVAWLRFWAIAIVETLGARRFARVLEARLQGRALDVSGAEHVPREGAFVLAVNHYHAGLTLDVIAATLRGASTVRASLESECAVVTGHRVRSTRHPGRALRAMRWLVGRFFARWSANVVRIRMSGDDGVFGLAGMRAWRTRAEAGPTLVFPEGVAVGDLTQIRPGAGVWLASLGMPVIPVGVCWQGERWRVSFGAPMQWAKRRDLRDVQLGMAMAELLPDELAAAWGEMLARHREVHSPRVVSTNAVA